MEVHVALEVQLEVVEMVQLMINSPPNSSGSANTGGGGRWWKCGTYDSKLASGGSKGVVILSVPDC
jgi:hypothetical protein